MSRWRALEHASRWHSCLSLPTCFVSVCDIPPAAKNTQYQDNPLSCYHCHSLHFSSTMHPHCLDPTRCLISRQLLFIQNNRHLNTPESHSTQPIVGFIGEGKNATNARHLLMFQIKLTLGGFAIAQSNQHRGPQMPEIA